MRSLRTALLVLALLVGAVAIAGCGSDEDSDQDYVEAAQDVATSFTQSADKLAKQISQLKGGLDLAKAGALLGTFSDSVESLADELDDISPPDAVEALHTRLIELLETFASKAQQASLALKAGDLLGGFPALSGFATNAVEVGGKVNSTVDEIQSKLGID